MHQNPSIELRDLRVGYGNKVILHKLNLTLYERTWTVLLGPNGSGKTTLLKTLMGQIEPFSGSALIQDNDCFDNALPLKRIVGYLPEEMFLYAELTGDQLLTFAGDMHGIPIKTMRDRIDELLELFKLSDHRNRRIKNYSLGMKRKLGVCLSLIHQPKVLLLDEPMNGLDPEAAETVRSILKKQCQQEDMTILMSTHNMGMLHQYCDSLLIFNNGNFLVKSSPEELFSEHPELTLEEIFLLTVRDKEQDPHDDLPEERD